MKYCVNCGKQVPDGVKFCANCGVNQLSAENERKKIYDGEIHKCPNCGEALKSFEAVCPLCSFEIRGIKSSSAVSELAKKIDELDRKNSEDIGLFKSIKQKLSRSKFTAIEQQKISLISNFPIPNTKEDILEFMILSYSHIAAKRPSGNVSEHDKSLHYELKKAWNIKFQQAYDKAKLCIKEESDFLEIQDYYNKVYDKAKKKSKKKVVFISAFISVMLLTAIIIGLVKKNDYGRKTEEIVWENILLGDNLPIPTSDKGIINNNYSDHFSVYICNQSESEYKSYVEKCKERGYIIDSVVSENSYDAYNESGYKLSLWYNEHSTEYRISLEDPINRNIIAWDTVKIMSKLPTPSSTTGEISYEYEDSFSVYILDTDKETYNEYVNLCMKEGFDKNYTKNDMSYSASNFWGYSLKLEYRGFNTMYLQISKK